MATPAQGIARLGFRTWYERQLIESHVYFITGFLCAVLIMALMEELNLRRPEPMSLASLAMIVVALLFGAVAIHRYLRLLGRAEMLAEQCVCPGCAVYGLIRVLDMGVVETGERPQWMRVSCKKCDRQWRMEST
jgi:hypothetical protein